MKDDPVADLRHLDDFTVAERLARVRWADGFCCGSLDEACHLATRPRVFQCRCCGAQRSVTAQTALHRTHVPLWVWLAAARLMARTGGVAAASLARHTRVHYESAWQILHKLRNAVADTGEVLRGAIEAARGYTGGLKAPTRNNWGFLVVLVDQRGRVVPAHMHAMAWHVRRLILHHGGQDRPPSVNPQGRARAVARWLTSRLLLTHGGVSQRWVSRYLWEAVSPAVQQEAAVIGRMLTAARASFAEIVPEFPTAYPDHAYHESRGFERLPPAWTGWELRNAGAASQAA